MRFLSDNYKIIACRKIFNAFALMGYVADIQPEYWNSENQQIIIPNFRLMNKEQKELKQYLTNQSEKLITLSPLFK